MANDRAGTSTRALDPQIFLLTQGTQQCGVPGGSPKCSLRGIVHMPAARAASKATGTAPYNTLFSVLTSQGRRSPHPKLAKGSPTSPYSHPASVNPLGHKFPEGSNCL